MTQFDKSLQRGFVRIVSLSLDKHVGNMLESEHNALPLLLTDLLTLLLHLTEFNLFTPLHLLACIMQSPLLDFNFGLTRRLSQ